MLSTYPKYPGSNIPSCHIAKKIQGQKELLVSTHRWGKEEEKEEGICQLGQVINCTPYLQGAVPLTPTAGARTRMLPTATAGDLQAHPVSQACAAMK